MRKPISSLAVAMSIAGLLASSGVLAQSGVEKAKQVCAACHGADGNGVQQFPDYPKLAGQHQDYLFKALRDYKNGARKNAIMGAQAQGLTTQEMRELARYYAAQKGSLVVMR